MITVTQFTEGGKLPANLTGNADFTIAILNEIFSALPGRFRFSSGWRSAVDNRAAGGVANSYHVQALAGDFVPVNGQFTAENKSVILSIINKYAYELIIHDVGSGLHYHIEPSPSFSKDIMTRAPSSSAPQAAAIGAGAFLGILVVVAILDEIL